MKKRVVAIVVAICMTLLVGCGKSEIVSTGITGKEFTAKMAEGKFTVQQMSSESTTGSGVDSYVAVNRHLSISALEEAGTEKRTYTTQEIAAMDWVESTVILYIYEDEQDAIREYEVCLESFKEKQELLGGELVETENKAYICANDWYLAVSLVGNTSMIVSAQEPFKEYLDEAFGEMGY